MSYAAVSIAKKMAEMEPDWNLNGNDHLRRLLEFVPTILRQINCDSKNGQLTKCVKHKQESKDSSVGGDSSAGCAAPCLCRTYRATKKRARYRRGLEPPPSVPRHAGLCRMRQSGTAMRAVEKKQRNGTCGGRGRSRGLGGDGGSGSEDGRRGAAAGGGGKTWEEGEGDGGGGGAGGGTAAVEEETAVGTGGGGRRGGNNGRHPYPEHRHLLIIKKGEGFALPLLLADDDGVSACGCGSDGWLAENSADKGFLRDTRYVTVEEQIALFLNTLTKNVSNRTLQERFQHSGETTSRHFRQNRIGVIDGIYIRITISTSLAEKDRLLM
ncbi:hypothetical protein ACMD2_21457 [Ananas comosus]|uniref:DUF8040 domain-containing protein n=1 Tax=Ananas comosus TaxID=4615 RepID=A0A199UI12_ANACO|nr:hypothetical protein ACMD2_21457 [Ananas comosus]